MSVSKSLAKFVVDTKYEALSPRTVHVTQRCVLDALGVSLAASGLGEGCKSFVEHVASQESSGACTILGFKQKVSPEAAALANGALAHAMDYEDAHDTVLLHPNAPTVPVVLAVAEAFGPVSGRELLAAVAIGCDVAVRLALGLRASMSDYGWYPPPILAAFGATAAAARLLKLTEAQVLDAFSLTLCQAVCPGEIKYSPHSVVRAVRDAFVARAAVTSALLAKRGVTGFEQPFEGQGGFFAMFARGDYEPATITRDLGARFEIEQISFKPWPSCRGTHASIEAALSLNVESSEIDSVELRGSRILRMLDEPAAQKRRPATAIDAKFSLPFTVATALVKHRVTLESFLPSALVDPQVLRVASKVRLSIDPALPEHTIGASMRLTLSNGSVLKRRVDAPLGHPANPLSETALMDKFIDCARYAAEPIEAEKARNLANTVLALDELSDVRAQLMSLLPA